MSLSDKRLFRLRGNACEDIYRALADSLARYGLVPVRFAGSFSTRGGGAGRRDESTTELVSGSNITAASIERWRLASRFARRQLQIHAVGRPEMRANDAREVLGARLAFDRFAQNQPRFLFATSPALRDGLQDMDDVR